jgi:cobalt-zinc-cadmium efflux system membrane fusion protein
VPMRSCFGDLGRDIVSYGARHFAAVVLFLLLCCEGAVPARAHESHDVQRAQTASMAAALPRLVANSETYELVAALDGLRLTIYLDRFRDNVPVTNANITVTINDEAMAAQPTSDGTYVAVSRQFGGRGLVELVFDIREPDADDLLIGKLSLGNAPPDNTASNPTPWYVQPALYLRHGAEDHSVLLSLTLLMGLALGVSLRRGRARAWLIIAVAVSALTLSATDRVAFAHEGHSLEDDAKMFAAPGNAAQRLPDGKVFVPKPAQRILDVRTVVAKSQTLPRSIVLVGRIITNPNRSGLVQSINGGRVIAPEQGLPRLGQAVAKGDVLASVEPPMPMADRTTISERVGELEQMIAVAEAKLKRLRPLAERQVLPQSLVIETEAELAGLYRRRELVRETRIAPEVLHAPIDGVVATARVVAGQVVQAQDLLFQIVDPNSLWIEAYDYGGNDPTSLERATAVAGASDAMKLGFEGWSRTLQQQATVLQFAIVDPPATLRVGQPITVMAQSRGTTRGIALDRDAIVRGGNGEIIVWRHVEPEYFEARPVRTEPLDATHLLVVGGIADGERIVIRGAELINQIR